MNEVKRSARAKRRAKTMRLIRWQHVQATCSKWSLNGTWNGHGLTPGEVQSVRKTARRDPLARFRNADGTIDQFDDDYHYIGAF